MVKEYRLLETCKLIFILSPNAAYIWHVIIIMAPRTHFSLLPILLLQCYIIASPVRGGGLFLHPFEFRLAW